MSRESRTSKNPLIDYVDLINIDTLVVDPDYDAVVPLFSFTLSQNNSIHRKIYFVDF